MKLISWNVNGLRSIFNKNFKELVSTLNPDIFCLQETKSEINQLNLEQKNFDNYSLDMSSAIKKGYSGVGNYYKHNYQANKILKGLGEKNFDQEGRYIISLFDNFTLYNIYFPSGSSGDLRQNVKYNFLDHFYEHLKQKKNLDNLIICGDFNICHKDVDIHHPRTAEKLELSGFLPKERMWMDKFCDLGFVDTYRLINGEKQTFSWWSYRATARSKNLGWRIDYFFVSKNLIPKVKNADILTNIYGSDHCPIILELNL